MAMETDSMRETLAFRMTRHIEVLCATANPGPWRLVKDTRASEMAEAIVGKWKDPVVRVVLALSGLSDQKPKGDVAKGLRISRRTVDHVWRDRLPNARILVYIGDEQEPTPVPIFKNGRERLQSPDGIRLNLKKDRLPFNVIQRIYEGNRPIVEAATTHEQGVHAQLAEHPEKAAWEREEAKRLATEAAQRAKGQLALIRPKTGTDDGE